LNSQINSHYTIIKLTQYFMCKIKKKKNNKFLSSKRMNNAFNVLYIYIYLHIFQVLKNTEYIT